MRIYYPGRCLRGQPYSSGSLNLSNMKALMAKPERHVPQDVLATAGAFTQVDFDFGEYTDFDYATVQGTFYIPRSIAFSDGRSGDFMDLYFVVMIGEDLELRRLRRDLSQPWHTTVGKDEAVSDPEILARIEQTMALLLEANRKPKKTPPVPSMDLPHNALLGLLLGMGMSEPDALAERIVAAAREPKKFHKRHAKALEEEFGLVEPYAGWHLDLLRAELERLGRLARVDWKEAPEEVLAQLVDLLPEEGRQALVAYEAPEECYPHEVLLGCRSLLAASCGLNVLLWDTGGDEYEFFVLESAKTVPAFMQAELLGIRLQTLEEQCEG